MTTLRVGIWFRPCKVCRQTAADVARTATRNASLDYSWVATEGLDNNRDARSDTAYSRRTVTRPYLDGSAPSERGQEQDQPDDPEQDRAGP